MLQQYYIYSTKKATHFKSLMTNWIDLLFKASKNSNLLLTKCKEKAKFTGKLIAINGLIMKLKSLNSHYV